MAKDRPYRLVHDFLQWDRNRYHFDWLHAYRQGPNPVPDAIARYARERGVGYAAAYLIEELGRTHWPSASDEHHGRLAQEVFSRSRSGRRGRVWTADTQPCDRDDPVDYPSLVPRDLDSFLRGGCSDAARAWVAAYSSLEVWVGWVVFPTPDGYLRAWAHEWCCTPELALLDPSIGRFGVALGWAYIGVPLDVEEELNAWEDTMDEFFRSRP